MHENLARHTGIILRGTLSFLMLATSLAYAAEPTDPAQKTAYRVPITVAEVEQQSMQRLTRVQGVIEAINQPQIKTRVSSQITAVYVDEGDEVTAGEVLAQLDDEGFLLDREAADANIQRLQVTLEKQRLDLKRDQSLSSQKLISDAALDNARLAVRQSEAQLLQAKALRNKAEYQLSHTRIISPISGRVQQRQASVGDFVNPMSPSSKTLFELVDDQHLRARLYFSDTLSEQIKQGMKLTLVLGSERIESEITRLRPGIDRQTQSLQALADFSNEYGWRPGEHLTARVVLETHPHALVVPEAALVRRAGGLVVYQLEDNKVHEVAVRRGIQQGDRIEIFGPFKPGDRLAFDGAPFLSDGVEVNVVEEAPR